MSRTYVSFASEGIVLTLGVINLLYLSENPGFVLVLKLTYTTGISAFFKII